MSRCSSFSYCVFLFAWLLGTTAGLTKPSSVKLEDNGYTGVVIAIHHSEKESPDLIQSLTYMVNNASSYLYKATKQRAYFKEVMILIPDTWGNKSLYMASPQNATFEDADIIVARETSFNHVRDRLVPYTQHYETCGKQAVHIHVPRSFFDYINYYDETGIEHQFSVRGKALVYEWGHYRWGLFNENADDGDNAEQFYFSTKLRKSIPIRCSPNWDATSFICTSNESCEVCNVSTKPNPACVSYPLHKQSRVTASIMSGHFEIEGIVDFCDDDADSSEIHDSEAPNKHNRLCYSRSNWSVMRDHPDFKNGNNPPRSIADVIPNIILARVKSIRVVLVLDSSGSMSVNDRISKLVSSARNFITSTAVNGSYIGIVEFKADDKKLSSLTLINSDQTRRNLSDLIPTRTSGGTCIGCGLEQALKILSENGASPAGGRVLLITDGLDNDIYVNKTEQMKNRCVEESVIVDCVVFTTDNKNLVNLTKDTGGKLTLQTDDAKSTGLNEAFLKTMESGVKEYDRKIVLFLDSDRYEMNESRSHSVYVDETVGRKTSFDFTYLVDSPNSAVDVTITSPSGNIYNSSYEGYKHDPRFKTASVEFASSEPGLWSYMVSNTHNTDDTISVTVSTYPSKEDVDPIIATADLSGSITDFANGESLSVFAEVKQGFNPIVGANVIATIVRPDALGIAYPPIDLELRDNGAGVDVTKDDGIYSRSFTNFTGVGYYGIKINVNNDDNTAIIVGPNKTASYLRNLNDAIPEEYLKENIPKREKRAVLLSSMSASGLTGKPAPKFTRGISGGSSRVPKTPANWTSGDDVIAPCKIVDLRVTSSSYENATVTLQFTSPGDDLDNGRADYYVVRKSSTAIDLRSNYTSVPTINETDILHGDIFSPGDFGDLEVFVIQVPIPRNQSIVSYTFAVHAVDESGNEGMTSNLAQAVLREPIPQALTTDSPTTILDKTTPAALPYEYDPKGWAVVLKVVFIAAGSLLAVVLLLVLGWHKLTQSSKKKKYGVQDVIVHSNKQPVPHENIAYKVEV